MCACACVCVCVCEEPSLGVVSGVEACTHCGELQRVVALHAVVVAVLLCVG